MISFTAPVGNNLFSLALDADAFATPVMPLADGLIDISHLGKGRRPRETMRGTDNPTPMAHRFFNAPATLFADAKWNKPRHVADRHGDAAHQDALARRLPDGKDLL